MRSVAGIPKKFQLGEPCSHDYNFMINVGYCATELECKYGEGWEDGPGTCVSKGIYPKFLVE